MRYDKNLFISNVYYLAKNQGLKIGQLESICGVSTGYFARLRQGGKNIAPGADFLLEISRQLSVSVDALLTFDFSGKSDSDIDLLQYIDKLTRETLNRTLAWQEDPFGYSESTPVRSDGTTMHPLFSTTPSSQGESAPYYNSKFHPWRSDLVPVKTYGCVLREGRTLYLVKIRSSDPEEAEGWQELELVMTGSGLSSPVPLEHTSHEKASSLDAPLYRLFDAVEDLIAHPQLTPEAKAMIREYLNGERKEND